MSLVFELLFLSQTEKISRIFCWDVLGMLLGCEWENVAVMVWAGGGSNFRGWGGLMLWSSQR